MQYRSIRTAALAASILTGLAACGSDGVAPPSTPQANGPLPLQSPGKSSGGKSTAAAFAPGPVMPQGAKYTIVCAQYTGPAHIAESKAVKDKLIQTTGHNDFYLLHDDNSSTLYFGYYREIERYADPAEAKRAQDDYEFLRSLTDSSKSKLFPGCLKQPLPAADPEGPAEYDLTKIDRDKSPDDPTRRYWSIAIAAYTVDAAPTGADAGKSRKQLAVESVIAARKAGLEAYYYNGENVSTVLIGAWPRAAMTEQESKDAHTSSDAGTDIIVSSAPLPSALTDQLNNSGRDVKVFQPKIQITDPSMLAAWKQYPIYSVNGEEQINNITDPQTGKTTARPQPTFLVEIPKLQPSALSTASPTAGDESGPPTMINPLGPGGGGGILRSVTK